MPATQVKVPFRRAAPVLQAVLLLTGRVGRAAPRGLQAMHAGPWGAAGTLFAIDISDGERPSSIKRKLAGPTGIPIESQKIMLGAFSQARAPAALAHGPERACLTRAAELSALARHALAQIMVGDKRGTVKFGTCGVTEGLGLTIEARSRHCARTRAARVRERSLRLTPAGRVASRRVSGCGGRRQAARASRHRQPHRQQRYLGRGGPRLSVAYGFGWTRRSLAKASVASVRSCAAACMSPGHLLSSELHNCKHARIVPAAYNTSCVTAFAPAQKRSLRPSQLAGSQRACSVRVQRPAARNNVRAQARVAAVPQRRLRTHVREELAQAVAQPLYPCAVRQRGEQRPRIRRAADALQQRARQRRRCAGARDELVPQPRICLALNKLNRLRHAGGTRGPRARAHTQSGCMLIRRKPVQGNRRASAPDLRHPWRQG